MSALPFGTQLNRSDIVGQKLVDIHYRHRFDVEGLDWSDAFFELDSGVTFALPMEDAGSFMVEPPLTECRSIEDTTFRSLFGKTIAAVVRPIEITGESPYLILDSGHAILHVMGAPHGVDYAGLYINSPGDLDMSRMVDFFHA